MSRVSTASSQKVGGRAGAAGVKLAKIRLGLLPVAAAVLGCSVHSIGLAATADEAAGMDASDSDGGQEASSADGLGGPAVDANAYTGDERVDLAPMSTDPSIVGCSDGTREGFRDITNWPSIAGCAGGWTSQGLLRPAVREPKCLRLAGNNSPNPEGLGCSASDLCGPTWHACLDGPDVESHSPTGGCESIVSPDDEAFFVVMTGASPQGVCHDDPSATNDLHGCGSVSIGQSESSECPPLTRRMSFADCAATGVWQCGTTADDSLREAEVVTKPGPSLGGVLCCKD
jgi:hypothetical protein